MKRAFVASALSLAVLLLNVYPSPAQGPLTPEEVLKLEAVDALQINPVKTEVLYSVTTPRGPNDKPGGPSTKYFRASMTDWVPIALLEDKPGAGSPQYSSDGNFIGFLYGNPGESRQVWVMNIEGGD